MRIIRKKTVGLLSPPTVFVVYGLPCAGMKIDCHGSADKGRLGLLTGKQATIGGAVMFAVRSADGK